MASIYPIDWIERAFNQVMRERRGPKGELHPIPEARVEEIFAQHRPDKSRLFSRRKR